MVCKCHVADVFLWHLHWFVQQIITFGFVSSSWPLFWSFPIVVFLVLICAPSMCSPCHLSCGVIGLLYWMITGVSCLVIVYLFSPCVFKPDACLVTLSSIVPITIVGECYVSNLVHVISSQAFFWLFCICSLFQ